MTTTWEHECGIYYKKRHKRTQQWMRYSDPSSYDPATSEKWKEQGWGAPQALLRKRRTGATDGDGGPSMGPSTA